MDGRGHGAARLGSLFPMGRSAGLAAAEGARAFLPMASHGMSLSDVLDVQVDGPDKPPEPRRLKAPELWQEMVAKALGTTFPVAVAGCGCQVAVAVAGQEKAVGEFVETYDAVTAAGTRAWAASAMDLWRGLDRKAATAVRDSFFDGYRAGVCAAFGLDDDPPPSLGKGALRRRRREAFSEGAEAAGAFIAALWGRPLPQPTMGETP